MNKKELRQECLQRHYETLEKLSEFLGKKQDGKKLSNKLLKLERKAHKRATDYCNGENGMQTEESWNKFTTGILAEVIRLFGNSVPGLFVNGDARGYALKIDDAKVRDFYPADIGLHRDWGGYGILSPEIE